MISSRPLDPSNKTSEPLSNFYSTNHNLTDVQDVSTRSLLPIQTQLPRVVLINYL